MHSQEVKSDLAQARKFALAFAAVGGFPAATFSDASEDVENESLQTWKERVLIIWLRQMMFVSGEAGEPSAETTGIIEEIVRQQVVEIVSLTIPLLPVANACDDVYQRLSFGCKTA